METSLNFHIDWSSALGISVILFLLMNFFYFIMGILTPPAFHRWGKWLSMKFGLVFSPRSDHAAFEKTTDELITEHPSLLIIKTTIYDMIAGLYLAHAILHLCIIWFGLAQGLQWAIWALTMSDLAIIGLFLLGVRNFSRNLIPLKTGDLMPYALLPGFILPVAAIAGFIGIY